jgi:hypothetical protein
MAVKKPGKKKKAIRRGAAREVRTIFQQPALYASKTRADTPRYFAKTTFTELLKITPTPNLATNRWRLLQRPLSCTRFRRRRVRCFMEQEVGHGEKAVYAGVQA